MSNKPTLQRVWSPEDYHALLRDIEAEPIVLGQSCVLDVIVSTERLGR